MKKLNPYNYVDQVPQNLRDYNLANELDQEQYHLFGTPTIYYKVSAIQENFDPVYRDLLSSKQFDEPIQLRSFFKIDESTTHGMTETGVSQNAERKGAVWFNISLIEHDLGRVPEIGDVVENTQVAQQFEIFGISKETHRLGRPLRYKCDVRLYQGTK